MECSPSRPHTPSSAEGLATEKGVLRRRMRRAVESLGAATRSASSQRIGERLAKVLRDHRRIAYYASLPDEVSTDAWIAERWVQGDSTFLPRMRSDGALDFVAVHGEGDLVRGPHSIREPREGLPAEPVETLDAVVLPARAFDSVGVRLGRGGGYYDRTFSRPGSGEGSPAPFLVGVAFRVQLVHTLPRAPHDLTVDVIVTEHGVEVPR